MKDMLTSHRKLLVACFALTLSVLLPAQAEETLYQKVFIDQHNNPIFYCGKGGECECKAKVSEPPVITKLFAAGSASAGTAGCSTCGGPGSGGGAPGGTDGTVDNSCTWILIGTGNPALGSVLPGGFFRVWAERPLASLYAPEGLRYVTGGYGMQGISREKTAGNVPRLVTVINPEGLEVDFQFADNASIGKPWGSTEDEDKTRLLMTDAEGWAATNNPAYYDLYTGGGDMYRFVAATNSDEYLELKLYKSVRGRVEDASSWVTDVIRDNSHVLRQVKSATSLADIVVANDHKYSINFYKLSDLQPGKDTNGFYVAVSGATPLVIWTIENPEPDTLKKLRVSKTLGTKTSTFDYVYIDASSEWQLSSGGGTLVKTSDQVWNEDRTYMLHTVIERDAGAKVLSKTATRYYTFPWRTERIEKVVDPDGQALKTEYVLIASYWA